MLILSRLGRAVAALPILFAVACTPVPEAVVEPPVLPVARWDHRPEATEWTNATLAALKTQGAVLISSTPKDIASYCPAYHAAGPEKRAAFWVGMFSAIAKYESTWNPVASGGGGKYLGLLQISPQTARGAGCDLSAGGLKDGASNLACAVRIAARRAPAPDAPVARITADWGPMHDSGKRAEMAAWISEQNYCQ